MFKGVITERVKREKQVHLLPEREFTEKYEQSEEVIDIKDLIRASALD